MAENEKPTKLKELTEIEPAKKTEKLVKIEKLIEKDPAAIAQMLKNWLGDQ